MMPAAVTACTHKLKALVEFAVKIEAKSRDPRRFSHRAVA
jgi:hypothetical protein